MPGDAATPRFISDRWFQPRDGEWRLMGNRCQACRKTFFPAKMVCPLCFDGRLEAVPLSGTGTLHTFAKSYMGPLDIQKPYLMGFIDLPEGLKLYALIEAAEPWEETLRIGLLMEMFIGVFKTDSSGREIMTYKFRPAAGEGVDHA
ncbi:MAG: OB-fold domain-containing protein [Pseudomonadota bacterium]